MGIRRTWPLLLSETHQSNLRAVDSCLLLPTCWKSLLISFHCSNCSQSCSCSIPAQVSISFSQLCLKVCINLPLILALHILVVSHILVFVAVMSTIQKWQYLQSESQVIRHHGILGWMSYGQKVCLALEHTWTLLLGKVLQPAAMFLQLTTQDEFVAGEKMLWRGSSTQALFFPNEN